MTIIKDRDTRSVYKLIGNVLFYAPLFNDGSIDEERWARVQNKLTPYHRDIMNKLLCMNKISASINKGIWDDPVG